MVPKFPTKKLDDIVERVCVGYVGSCNKDYTTQENGVPMIRTTNLTGTSVEYGDMKYISGEFHKKNIKSQLKKGDILVARHGDSGLPSIYETDEEANCLNVVIVKPFLNANLIDNYFILYAIKSPSVVNQIKASIGGSVQGVVNTKVIAGLDIPFPERLVREKIVRYIFCIDKKIQLNHQTNQTLEQIAQTIFKSWFVDFEPVKAKIQAKSTLTPTLSQKERKLVVERAAMCAISGKSLAELEQLSPETQQQLKTTAALFPDALVDSELGEIPMGWGVQTIEDVIDLTYGKSLKKTNRVKGNFPVYGSGGLTGTHNKSLVDGPGIIVGRKGSVGTLFWEDKSFFPIDTVFYVKCKNSISLVFAYYMLQTLGLKDMNTDAAVPGLNRKNVYRLVIPKFPIEIIHAFSELCETLRSKIFINIKEADSLETIRDIFLPKLLSGELSLNTTSKAPEQAST